MLTAEEVLWVVSLSLSALSGGFALDHIFGSFSQQPLNLSNKKFFYRGIAHDYMEIVYHTIFGSFGANFFTIKYASRAFLFSILVSLTVVFAFYIIHPSTVVNYIQSPRHIIIIVVVIFGNGMIDWLSIFQTQILLKAALDAESKFQSLLFLFADIVVSLNFFILIYAAIVASTMFFYVIPNLNEELKNSDFSVTYDFQKYQGVGTYIFEGEARREPPAVAGAGRNPNLIFQGQLATSQPFLNVATLLYKNEIFTDPIEDINFDLFIDEEKFEGDFNEFSEIVASTPKIRFRIIVYSKVGGKWSPNIPIYAAAYSMIDQVETGLWSIFEETLFSISVDEMFGIQLGSYSPAATTDYCYDGNFLQTIDEGAKCDETPVAFVAGFERGYQSVYYSVLEWLRVEFPLAPFFVSSIAVTIALYVCVVFFPFFIIFRKIALVIGAVATNLFSKGPFSITLFLGMLISSTVIYVFIA